MNVVAWNDVFKDQKNNLELKSNGFVKFELCDKQILDQTWHYLKTVDQKFPENDLFNFYAGVQDTDTARKRNIHEYLKSVLDPILSETCPSYRSLTYTYLIKGIGEKSILRLHQDWSIVDETEFRGYTLWIPMMDSNKKNGQIHFLKGSQNFRLNIRGGGIPPKFLSRNDQLVPYMEPVDVKYGEALIFDNRIIHFSSPNLSQNPRVSIITPIVPQNAQTYVFNCENYDSQKDIKKYSVPDDFYLRYEPFVEKKDLPPLFGKYVADVVDHNAELASEDEISELLRYCKTKKLSLIQRFLKKIIH